MKASPYYPLFFNLRERTCVVVGGGRVAERKVRTLLSSGARVRLVSPRVTRGIARLAEQGRIDLVLREYWRGDLEGAALAFVAVDDEEASLAVRDESRRLAIPLNVADNPDLCDFIVPSLVARGPLLMAISTSGLLPMLSKKLRKDLEGLLSVDCAAYARRVGAFRRFLLKQTTTPRQRREIMARIAGAPVPEVARMTLAEMKARFLARESQGPSRGARK